MAVPVPGTHARRVLHGALNVQSGDVLLFITETWDHTTHPAFLRMIRAHWRAGRLSSLRIGHPIRRQQVVGWPSTYCAAVFANGNPELNAMDHLWRYVKGRVLANRPVTSIDTAADQACQAILALSRRERLRKARVLSGHFWLRRALQPPTGAQGHSIQLAKPVLTPDRSPTEK